MKIPIKLDHLSKQRKDLVQGAEAKGYNITQHGNNEIFILKGGTCRSRGVILFEDGSIFRTDIRFDIAKPLTVKDAKKHLEI
jgi:hypothetical protein